MITISNDPITGLKRKLTYDFYWLSSTRRIVIQCTITSYNELDEKVENARVKTYDVPLIASDSMVDPTNGHIYTPEELAADPELPKMQEYDFYVYVIGSQAVLLPALIETIIQARDLEGKFDK